MSNMWGTKSIEDFDVTQIAPERGVHWASDAANSLGYFGLFDFPEMRADRASTRGWMREGRRWF